MKIVFVLYGVFASFLSKISPLLLFQFIWKISCFILFFDEKQPKNVPPIKNVTFCENCGCIIWGFCSLHRKRYILWKFSLCASHKKRYKKWLYYIGFLLNFCLKSHLYFFFNLFEKSQVWFYFLTKNNQKRTMCLP